MTLQDRLTLDALIPGYLAAMAKREFDTALAEQQAKLVVLGDTMRRVRGNAAMASQKKFWESMGLNC